MNRALRSLLLVGGLYALLTVLFTWPMPSQLGSHIFGARRDAVMFLWNTWWAPHAVFELGSSPLRSDLLFHPEGASLVVHTHAVLPALLSAPLQWLFGLVPAMNLVVLLTYVLAGVGTYLLVQEVVQDRRAAVVAGAMFAFCHYRSSMVLFLNLIQTQFLAFYAWALWCAWRRRSAAWGALAAAFAAALLYSSYNLFLFALLWSGLFLLYAVARDLSAGRPLRSLALPLASLTVVGAVLAVPLGLEVRRELGAHGYYGTKEDNPSYHKSVPVRRLLVKNPLHRGDERPRLPLQEASFLGYGCMALAVLGVFGQRRRPALWFWLACALLFLWCSLGVRWNWDAVSLQREVHYQAAAWMPYTHLRDLPLLDQLRNPHRYGLMGALALAVVAGFGLRWLLERIPAARRGAGGNVLVVAALGVVTFDYLQVPFPKTFALPEVPPVLERIAADPGEGCVFEFPAGRDGYPSFSYFETIHQKPVYRDGQLARTPPALLQLREKSALFTTLRRAFRGQKIGKRERASLRTRLHKEVQEQRIRWLLVSWVDDDVLWNPQKSEPAALEHLHEVVMNTLPVAEVCLKREPEEVRAWAGATPRQRRSHDGLFAVYRLEESPDSSSSSSR